MTKSFEHCAMCFAFAALLIYLGLPLLGAGCPYGVMSLMVIFYTL